MLKEIDCCRLSSVVKILRLDSKQLNFGCVWYLILCSNTFEEKQHISKTYQSKSVLPSMKELQSNNQPAIVLKHNFIDKYWKPVV